MKRNTLKRSTNLLNNGTDFVGWSRSSNLRIGFGLLALSLVFSCNRQASLDDSAATGLNRAPANADYIQNGEPVASDDVVAASTVALYINSLKSLGPEGVRNFCTGTLIGSNYVLTAAHCLMDFAAKLQTTPEIIAQNILVGFGLPVVTAKTNTTVEWRKVTGFKVHSEYKVDSVKNIDKAPMYDVAVLRLDSAAPNNYRPVALAGNTSALVAGASILLAGYGLTDGLAKTRSTQLMKVAVQIDNPTFSLTQFTFKVQNGKGSCSGDSGGPAYVVNDKGGLSVIGITSWGDNNCQNLGAYTSVPYFASWIVTAAQSLGAQ